MLEVELHDEVVEWLLSLDDPEWDRAVVVIDRLANLGPAARMPRSRSLGDGLSNCGSPSAPPPGGSPTGSPKMDGLCCDDVPQATSERTGRVGPSEKGRRGLRSAVSMKEKLMANYSRWADIK
ncbi:MAG: hypothetical protein ACRD0U_18450, partial [Acidimicrobiales bacterium]